MLRMKPVFLPLLALTLLSGGPAAAALVTTSLTVQFADTVWVSNTATPEWVSLTGQIHFVAAIDKPKTVCLPVDPCRAVPIWVYTNLDGVTGIGQTTGRRYQATGAQQTWGIFDMPGNFGLTFNYSLTPSVPCKCGQTNMQQIGSLVTVDSQGVMTSVKVGITD